MLAAKAKARTARSTSEPIRLTLSALRSEFGETTTLLDRLSAERRHVLCPACGWSQWRPESPRSDPVSHVRCLNRRRLLPSLTNLCRTGSQSNSVPKCVTVHAACLDSHPRLLPSMDVEPLEEPLGVVEAS